MKLIRLIWIASSILLGILDSQQQLKALINLASPEATLKSYVECFKLGDTDGVRSCFYSLSSNFILTEKYPIDSYKISKRTICTNLETQVLHNSSVSNLFQIGDVEILAEIKAVGRKELWDFCFRKYESGWKIFYRMPVVNF